MKFRCSLRLSEGRLNDVSLKDFHPFPLSINKIHLIGNKKNMDFDFYLLTTPGGNYTRNYTDIKLQGWQI